MRDWAITISRTLVSMALGFLVALAMAVTASPTDDSDAGPDRRSGMRIHTDHKTGLQYLGAGGCVTPRVDADGRHMRAGTEP